MKKKLLALISLLLVFQLGFVKANVVAAQENDDVVLSKTAYKIDGTLNQWDVTLNVKVKPKIEKQDVLLVIDTSGSMNKQNRIDYTKEAAIQFIEAVLGNEDSESRVGIIEYNSRVKTVIDFTDNKDMLIDTVKEFKAEGNTASHEALHQARMLLNTPTDAKQSMIFLTDGEPTIVNKFKEPLIDDFIGNDVWKLSGVYDSGLKEYELDFDNAYVKGKLNMENNEVDSFFNYGEFIASTTPFSTPENGYHVGEIRLGTSGNLNNYLVNLTKIMEIEGLAIKNSDVNVYTAAIGTSTQSNESLENIASTPDKFFNIAEPEDIKNIYSKLANEILFPYKEMSIEDPMGEGFDLYNPNEKDVISNNELLIKIDPKEFTYNQKEKLYEYEYKYKIRSNEDVIAPMETGKTDFLANGKTTFNYDTDSKDFIVPTINPTVFKIHTEYRNNGVLVNPLNYEGIGDYVFDYNDEEILYHKTDNVIYYIPYYNVTHFDSENEKDLDGFIITEINLNGRPITYSGLVLEEGLVNSLELIHDKIDPIDPVEPVNPVEPVSPINPVEPLKPNEFEEVPSESLPNTGQNNLVLVGATMLLLTGMVLILKGRKSNLK